MSPIRHPHTRRLVGACLSIGLLLGLTACSDDGGDSADGGGSVSDWCDAARDLKASNSDPAELNDPAVLASFSEDLQSLADDAPAEIAADMSVYVDAALTNFASLQSGATTDPSVSNALLESGVKVDAYLEENCDGFSFAGDDADEE